MREPLPFTRQDRRKGFREGTGVRYYGRELARLLEEEERIESPVERVMEWCRRHEAEMGFILGFLICAAIVLVVRAL